MPQGKNEPRQFHLTNVVVGDLFGGVDTQLPECCELFRPSSWFWGFRKQSYDGLRCASQAQAVFCLEVSAEDVNCFGFKYSVCRSIAGRFRRRHVVDSVKEECQAFHDEAYARK